MKKFIRIVCLAAITTGVGCVSSHERIVEKEKERPVVRERVIEQAPTPSQNTTIIK